MRFTEAVSPCDGESGTVDCDGSGVVSTYSVVVEGDGEGIAWTGGLGLENFNSENSNFIFATSDSRAAIRRSSADRRELEGTLILGPTAVAPSRNTHRSSR